MVYPMNPQQALQLFETLTQISATLLAVYLAAMIYSFQQNIEVVTELATKQAKLLVLTFLTGCALYCITIISSLYSMFSTNLAEEVPDLVPQVGCFAFLMALLFSFASVAFLITTVRK